MNQTVRLAGFLAAHAILQAAKGGTLGRRGFAVHRPKFFAFEDEGLPEAHLATAFFRGVGGHETGGKFWREHCHESY